MQQPSAPKLTTFDACGQVSVNESELAMAGGNINPISVNVTLQNQPSSWSIVWSVLGQWLLCPGITSATVPPGPRSTHLPQTAYSRSPGDTLPGTFPPDSDASEGISQMQAQNIDIVCPNLRCRATIDFLLTRSRWNDST